MSELFAWTCDPAAQVADDYRRMCRTIRWMAPVYVLADLGACAYLRPKMGAYEARQFAIIALVAFAIMATVSHAWAALAKWAVRWGSPLNVMISSEEIQIGTVTIRLSDILRVAKRGRWFLKLHLRDGSRRTTFVPESVSRQSVLEFLQGAQPAAGADKRQR